ncbi:hypothetical protein [Aminipila terrae]|uniref:Uncharacterized protein n=1 Tax=Aminipila terrae TaxID=2697030 RepID=A0A6P1MB11_9FIRM|nr:hypothetical protein [Aminipila terrae]QHI71117.1 hypothetical protein Ami3637_00800 [Aminipila terrae]
MACFLVPLGEVIITSAVQKVVEKKERKVEKTVESQENAEKVWLSGNNNEADTRKALQTGFSWSQKLSWLNRMLWGGVILLAFEHLWHGEIVPWPPFLTAMNNPADIGPMLHEIATIGTGMALFITIVWTVMVMIADEKSKTALKAAKAHI